MGFNASQTYYNLSDLKGSLLTCPVIQCISNNDIIDKSHLSNKLPLRVKQTSKAEDKEKFHELQEVVKGTHNTLKLIIDMSKVQRLDAELNEILSRNFLFEVVKQSLCDHNIKCIGEVKEFLNNLSAAHNKVFGPSDINGGE